MQKAKLQIKIQKYIVFLDPHLPFGILPVIYLPKARINA